MFDAQPVMSWRFTSFHTMDCRCHILHSILYMRYGLVEFGKEGNKTALLSFFDTDPIPIKYFSFTAWNGVEAKFLYDCPVAGENGTEFRPNSKEVDIKMSNSERLKKALLQDRAAGLAPGPTVPVKFGVKLTTVRYDPFETKLDAEFAAVASWTDESMAWNPAKFNGTTELKFSLGQIWIPQFSVFNSADIGMLEPRNADQITMLYSGEATLHFQAKTTTWCSYDEDTLNKLNCKPGLPVSVEGINDHKCIADMFKDHFAVKSPLGPSQDSDTGPGGRGITTRFTAKEVCMAIKSMSRGKSPGHDGLSIEHLQHAGPHLPRTLAMLYNLCIAHSYLPAEMLKTVVVPIVKNKTGDKCHKNNYRPISLATIVAKVLDSLLNSELDKYLNIHDNQFGFKQGLSTESAILCLKQTVKYYTSRRTPIYACFLDLSKAFDLVSYDILWQKLSEAEMPPELNNIFKCWYQSQINVVRWSNALSEPYRLECGVRQGGLTSPKLFNLYVNALIKELSETRVGCHIDNVCINNISYADDMVLLSVSVCGITKLLGICERYASSHGLKYNVSKSECMVFRVGSKAPSCVPPIKLNGSPLKIVEQFKYLGHVITADLKDNADIERERRALSVRANMIARRFARCSAEVKITLFRAYCSSFYTSSLWVNHTQRAYNALRVQYNNAFRVLMGLPRFCSASGMFAAARVDCFHATMRKRCTSLVRRVRASANTILALFANRFDLQYMNHCCMIHVLEVKPGMWPRDKYECLIILERWNVHEILELEYLNPTSAKMKTFTAMDNFQENVWKVTGKQGVLDKEMSIYRNEMFNTNTTKSDMYFITLGLERHATTYNIVFYTPLLVLMTFLLLSFWTEPLKMSRVWFYAGTATFISVGLSYVDCLIPCHSVPSILVLYVCLLAGVSVALVLHICMMTPLVQPVYKSRPVQYLLTSKVFRMVFCLTALKTCNTYESINRGFVAQEDDDSGVLTTSRSNVEEMQYDNHSVGEREECAEVVDKLLFTVYSVLFAVLLAFHF
ncbi:unnamed protein product [Plutella xylostella]|uniref:(diamondback moth) hypothetical protein n=1 Tax=Plutella xylostella TaxID=51655 RepID=A0A8S4F597_PLUXY|nr:unnamed protein product [Plutella xylostella]